MKIKKVKDRNENKKLKNQEIEKRKGKQRCEKEKKGKCESLRRKRPAVECRGIGAITKQSKRCYLDRWQINPKFRHGQQWW